MSMYAKGNLEALAALGGKEPEPSEEYMNSLGMLDDIVHDSIHVSRQYGGIRSPTASHFYASVLFTTMITRAVSLLNLAPHSGWALKKIESWDYSSMTGIARTILELRATFHYLCVDKCSEDEWNCRWNIFNLHDCMSRIRMFIAQGVEQQVEGLNLQAEELREKLRSNPFFQALDVKRHKKLLHGQTAYLFPLETMMAKSGMSVETFRWIYVLFSTHVHALPMSFYRIGGDFPERGRGLPSFAEEGYSSLCLSLAASMLVGTRDDVHVLFEGLSRPYPVMTQESPVDTAASEDILDIGQEVSIDLSDDIRLTRRRVSENTVIVAYVDIPTETVVFEGEQTISGELQFNSFDPYFWTILIDDRPGTIRELEKVIDGKFLM